MLIRSSRSAFLVMMIVTVVSCSDDDEGGGPVGPPTVEGSSPSVLATVSLSDAPVEGEFVLTPPAERVEGAVWDFAVDLDGDGAFDDAEGQVDVEQRVPYRFTEVGLHRIAVRFERGGTERTEERIVAVNDPEAFVIERRFQFNPDSARPEGIAVTKDNAHLFVGGGFVRKVFRLRTDDLSVVDSVSLRGLPTNTLEGLALSPSETRLFVINKFGTITTLSVPGLQILDQLADNTGVDFFIEAQDDRHVIVSGGQRDLVIRVDVVAGVAAAQREIDHAWDIELSPMEDEIAVVTRNFGGRSEIQLLDAMTLENQWTARSSRPLALTSVAFHPSGERVYAFGLDDEAYWLIVLRTTDGAILGEIRIEPRGDNQVSGVANPTATTHDGRFVIFPTDLGAYFVDTSLDVPRFRLTGRTVGTPPPRLVDVGCCNVATPENTNAIYFVNFGEVFKVQLTK